MLHYGGTHILMLHETHSGSKPFSFQRLCSDLEEHDVILLQLVIVFDLDGNGLVRVDVPQLNVCRVTHEEGAIEASWSQPCGEEI